MKMKMNKIERNLSFTEYQSYREEDGDYPALNGLVINSSCLSDIDEQKRDSGSALRFRYNHVLDRKEKNSDLPALKFGRAFHSYILEPETFADEYIVEDADLHDRILARANDEQSENGRKLSGKFSKSLNAWKEFVEEMQFEGKEIISASAMNQIESMAHSATDPKLAADKKTVEIFNSTTYETELSVFTKLTALGGDVLPCKARFDLIEPATNHNKHSGRGMIVDVKSIAEWSPGNAIENWKWYRQMAFYRDIGISAGLVNGECRCGWIFVEKSPPFEAHFHEAEDCLLNVGRIEYKYLLSLIHKCAETNVWPGHGRIVYPHSLEKKLEEVQVLV